MSAAVRELVVTPDAVQAAQEVMGCQRSIYGPWCIAHSHLAAYRAWTDRGCAYAVAVADAVVKVTTEDEVILWRCMKCGKWSFAGRKPRCHTRRADGRSQWCGPFRKWIARKS